MHKPRILLGGFSGKINCFCHPKSDIAKATLEIVAPGGSVIETNSSTSTYPKLRKNTYGHVNPSKNFTITQSHQEYDIGHGLSRFKSPDSHRPIFLSSPSKTAVRSLQFSP